MVMGSVRNFTFLSVSEMTTRRIKRIKTMVALGKPLYLISQCNFIPPYRVSIGPNLNNQPLR